MMMMSAIQELLIVRKEDVRRAREHFGKTERDIEEDLDVLLEWLAKQPHLPKDHDRRRLEAYLLRNKFQVEKTKHKLDKYYTYRGIYSDFFLNLDPTSAATENVRKSILWVPMPKLLPSMERVSVLKFLEKQEHTFNLEDLFTYMLMILDLQLTHDYAVAERYLIDASHFSMKYVLKMDISSVSKGLFLTEQVFSGRLSCANYFNLPPWFEYVLGMLKQVLKPKLFNKITTHKTLESLYEVVPKEYLPKDYGGDQESLAVLHEKWGKELEFQKDFLEANAKRISDEKLRIGEPMHSELFGADGTFKKMNLD